MNKKLIIVELIINIILFLGGIAMFVIGIVVNINEGYKALLICIGILVILISIFLYLLTSYHKGAYKCDKCGYIFYPSFRQFIFSLFTFSKRKLRCPQCGDYSFKRRTKEDITDNYIDKSSNE